LNELSNQNIRSAHSDIFGDLYRKSSQTREEESRVDSVGLAARLPIVKSTNRGTAKSPRVLLKDPALRIPSEDILAGDDICEFIKNLQ